MTTRSRSAVLAAVAAVCSLGCGHSSSDAGPPKGAGGSGMSAGGAFRAGGAATVGGGAGTGNTGVGGGAAAGGSAGVGGRAGPGGASSAGSAGVCFGPGCSEGGMGGEVSAARACREYFTEVCARIRECGAPTFRPCESPIDACPDILFADDSTWTVSAVLACTAEWKTADCTALMTDQGPACSQVPGRRPLGDSCVFDAQCEKGHCNDGIVPRYQATCGTCADLAPSHGACDEQHVCPAIESCHDGSCIDDPPPYVDLCRTVKCPAGEWCDRGQCVAPLAAGAPCSSTSVCADGLACEIEIIPEPDPEPAMGVCQPLPPIGEPCLATYGHIGVCDQGGTCNLRPTGDCVELGKVGEYCGYTSCVEGAYCQVLGYMSIPSHLCYALGDEGDPCPHEGFDLGKSACMEGFDCVCSEPGCVTGVCTERRTAGETCNASDQPCETGTVCQGGICVRPDVPAGSIPAGYPCFRSTAYGREPYSCQAGLDCLCPDDACEAPLCATARDSGQSCGTELEICRQGLVCSAGKCTEVIDRGIEAASCGNH